MKKIIDWFATDSKWAWLIIGLIIGFWSDGWYCSCWAGAVGIAAYVCFYHKEFKMKGSFLLMALILLMSVAGYGLAYLFTEQ